MSMVFKWSFIEKHKMMWLILEIYNRCVSVLNIYPKVIDLPKFIIMRPLFFCDSRCAKTHNFENLLDVCNVIFLFNFQIFLLKTKIFLYQLNNRLVDARKLSSFYLEQPLAYWWKDGCLLILLDILLRVWFNYRFPVIEPLVLDFTNADLRILLIYIALLLGHGFLYLNQFDIVKFWDFYSDYYNLNSEWFLYGSISFILGCRNILVKRKKEKEKTSNNKSAFK